MSEASAFWYARVEKAIGELRKVLADHERALVARAIVRTQPQLVIRERQAAPDEAATAIPEQKKAA
jgi:hypothetical protein